MLKGFQFKHPNDKSERMCGEDFNKDEVTAHFGAYKQLQKVKKDTHLPKNILGAAVQIIKSNWGIGPTRINIREEKYRLGRSRSAMHWGDITHAKYLHYKQQVDLLNGDGNASTYESVLHDDDDKFEENALIFASEDSLSKRQRTS